MHPGDPALPGEGQCDSGYPAGKKGWLNMHTTVQRCTCMDVESKFLGFCWFVGFFLALRRIFLKINQFSCVSFLSPIRCCHTDPWKKLKLLSLVMKTNLLNVRIVNKNRKSFLYEKKKKLIVQHPAKVQTLTMNYIWHLGTQLEQVKGQLFKLSVSK